MPSEHQERDEYHALQHLMEDDEALADLLQEDMARYRQLHEQALAHLAQQLMDGEPNSEIERVWTAVYERLANLFLSRDTAALLQLNQQVQPLPLQTDAAQHMRQFFLGIAYLRQAEYPPALAAFTDLLGKPHIELALKARTRNAQAVIYRVTGRWQDAMSGYEASLALWQALGDVHFQGIVNLNLGIISYNLRRYAQAETYLQAAETFFQQAGSTDWLNKTQSERGLVQRDLGNWDKALAFFDAYIAQAAQAESWEDVGVGEVNRGEVLLFKGDIPASKQALQRALELTVSRTYRVDPLLYLGLAHQAEGDFVTAEAYYQQAINLAEAIDRREILPHVFYYQGDVLRRQGRDDEALAYWQKAATVIEESHTPLRDESLKISLLGRWQQVYEALVLHCATLGRIGDAFMWAERARARAFAEGLADDDGKRPFSNHTITSLPQLQATLPPNTILFCYFTTGVLEQDLPLLRAIPKDSPLRPHILTPAKTLRFDITAAQITFHECPLDPNLFATHSPRGFDVTRFLKPVVLHRLHESLLPNIKENHLVIVPHGPLHRVPFTALLAEEATSPTLTFAPSGTIYAQQRNKHGMAKVDTAVSCLTFGYNNGLQYAELEAQIVAETMNGQVLIKSDSTKQALQKRAENCRYLHIACHGWFNDSDPLASYLEVEADEQLTAKEILENWQLNAELVTLSACETGISQILRGDEPMGLVRAFLYAGAQAVLVSQWRVDDLATFLLMTRFYAEIELASGNLSVALANAQLWLRGLTAVSIQQLRQQHDLPASHDAGEYPFAAPQFWAGFVIVGG